MLGYNLLYIIILYYAQKLYYFYHKNSGEYGEKKIFSKYFAYNIALTAKDFSNN